MVKTLYGATYDLNGEKKSNFFNASFALRINFVHLFCLLNSVLIVFFLKKIICMETSLP